jgi:hypothetical protein
MVFEFYVVWTVVTVGIVLSLRRKLLANVDLQEDDIKCTYIVSLGQRHRRKNTKNSESWRTSN